LLIEEKNTPDDENVEENILMLKGDETKTPEAPEAVAPIIRLYRILCIGEFYCI